MEAFLTKRRMTMNTGSKFVSAIALAAIALLALGPKAEAQQDCSAFRAIWLGSVPPAYQLVSTDDGFSGPVYASLGGELLVGAMSGNDGVTTGHGVIGMGRGGEFKICFSPLQYRSETGLSDCAESFTIGYRNGVWPFPGGQAGFGEYKANTTIIEGAGRFQFASGHIDLAGPFVFGQPSNADWFFRAGVQLSGQVCGVR
jgi:hypothetical protein